MKKLLSTLLAMILILTVCVTASAEGYSADSAFYIIVFDAACLSICYDIGAAASRATI